MTRSKQQLSYDEMAKAIAKVTAGNQLLYRKDTSLEELSKTLRCSKQNISYHMRNEKLKEILEQSGIITKKIAKVIYFSFNDSNTSKVELNTSKPIHKSCSPYFTSVFLLEVKSAKLIDVSVEMNSVEFTIQYDKTDKKDVNRIFASFNDGTLLVRAKEYSDLLNDLVFMADLLKNRKLQNWKDYEFSRKCNKHFINRRIKSERKEAL
jgi:hypothetical protein